MENLVSKTFQAKLQAQNNTHNTPFTKTEAEAVIENKIDSTDQGIILEAISLPKDSSKKTSDQQLISFVKKLSASEEETEEIEKYTSKMVEETITEKPKSEWSTANKTREEVKAEREAKKLAKQQAKKKNKDVEGLNKEITLEQSSNVEINETKFAQSTTCNNESLGQKNIKSIESKLSSTKISDSENKTSQSKKEKKPSQTKAERRAIQEAQRAAKAAATTAKSELKPATNTKLVKTTPSATKDNSLLCGEKLPLKLSKDCKVKLFNHLENCRKDSNLFANNSNIHPIVVRLGEQYAKRTIVGSNARCISFLNALKKVIQDYETPAKKEFARSLESNIKDCVDHLHKCRPLAVSVWNAYKHIKNVLTQLSVDQPESELKEHLCHFIDTYIENQIGKAAEAISISVQDKISNGDVILTFGCSSLINYIFEEAHRREVDFRVIVVDSRPFLEGQELLRRLTANEIPCTYVLINAVGFVMPEVTKILLGAHALLSNGYVMARTGTAQVALVARSFNVPVLVCCETHKFSERFQTDAIVYNELGNPDDLIMSNKCRLVNWESQNKLCPLNLNYDITPPELVTAVVTEVAILPCTSVPVILRIKPTEIGY